MRISVCIPQYNRSAYLLKALESIRVQTHPDVEVVVADDCSTDDTATVVPAYLEASGLRYSFFRHPRNIGYDGNLRSALAAATGDYLFILGNDDCLPEERTLANVATCIEAHGRPAVVLGNVSDYASPNAVSTRVRATENLGHGVELALQMFRAFSCVAGLVFERCAFHRVNTTKYDDSIYVQMFLASSIIANGGDLLTIKEPIAVVGSHVDGKHANSYVDNLQQFNWRYRPALGGLDQVGRVVCDAILPCLPEAERQNAMWRIFRQLLTYSYTYWLYDYRKHDAYWASLNLAIGCFPTSLTRKVSASPLTLSKLLAVYLPASIVGLGMPLMLLEPVKDIVRSTSRRFA